VTLAPADSYSLPIRQLYDGLRWRGRAIYWTAPGEYTLTATYGLSNAQGDPSARLQSEPVKLTVTAPGAAPGGGPGADPAVPPAGGAVPGVGPGKEE
jgi:hypothetical protein